MKISSPKFKDGEKIPKDYTRDGADKSPPLHIEQVPEKAKSLALIMDDPDATKGTFNHWLLFNVDPSVHDIHEGSAPVMATQGRNDWGEVDYGGPKPPSGGPRRPGGPPRAPGGGPSRPRRPRPRRPPP